MKTKNAIKLGCAMLLSATILVSGVFVGKTAYESYGIHKREKKFWLENISKFREAGKQNYHPSKTKVLHDKTKNENTDIYCYEPTFKSRFLFDLSYKVNKIFGADFMWGFEKLTKDKTIDKDPAYSPDGEYIIFSSNANGSFDIWIMDENGKNKTQVTKSLGDETMPEWVDCKTLKYHAVKDGKSFYETIDLGSSKILEQVLIERGAFVGERATNFSLKSINGKQYALDDYFGKVVLLNFWSILCGPCREEIPSLEEFYKNRHENVEVLSLVAYDRKSNLEDFVKEKGVTYPVLYDEKGDVFDKYKIGGIPVTIVINKDGKIVDRHLGTINFTDKKFNEYIKEMVDESQAGR